ncbi:MAG TPA: OB-fold domain-containing protein [Steroidobacteraceae bacterium]
MPRLRLARSTIQQAMGWLSPPNVRPAAGERAVCNWDEDSLTLGVEAARGCLRGQHPPRAVTLASTTLPFLDRSNAALLATALDLAAGTETLDVTGTLRAGTTALAQALRRGDAMTTLLVASDAREARPGSQEEMDFGAAAVALLLAPADSAGSGPVLAQVLATAHLAADFVDHYRMEGEAFDYALEERWVRDAGIAKLLPQAIATALASAGISAADVQHCVLPVSAAAAQRLVRAHGLDKAQLTDTQRAACGEAGVAQPLLMLAAALEIAIPGENILLVGFGQGVDVTVLRVPANAATGQRPLAAALGARREEKSYTRYLSHRGLLEVDFGKRAERDNRSAPSVMWRKSRQLTGFVGGRCSTCATVQFPKSRVCVNPACRASDTQEDLRLAELAGRVKSFTEDWQAYAPRPPAMYGNVEFEGGGNLLMEITDAAAGELAVGMPVRFVFRIKDVDRLRAFRRYFWKATGR